MANNFEMTNKTGKNSSLLQNEELIKFTQVVPPDIQGNAHEAIMKVREDFVLEAETVGSIPIPDALNPTSGSEDEALKAILLDKIGERIAYERTGVRIYEALIAKLYTLKVAPTTLSTLKKFRDEEAEHLTIVTEAMIALGGDPTAETPCADVVAVASSGILKVITDPRTDVAQSLQALLGAELIDTASWELLILLVEKSGYDELLNRFQKAYEQETIHQETIKSFLIGLF